MSAQRAPASRFWREPLVHFVVAGAVLFTAFALVRGPAPAPADEYTIVVDRRALLTYMQYRANAFEPETFAAALDAMSDRDLEQLIGDYVEEEALYREAVSLGLEQSDYIMRQRMIQKIRFLLGDAADSGREIDETALHAYFTAHRADYAIAPSVTFTHVFFDTERRGAEHARADAVEAQRVLEEAGARFNDASGQGDRFPFLKNYVERTYDYVASQFGTEFAETLAKLSPSEHWQGPIRSAYGEHIVLLTQRTEGRLPELAEVRDQVERDYLRERSEADLAQLTDTVRRQYRVEVLDVRPGEAE